MDITKLPTSFPIRPRAIERFKAGKPLTRNMSCVIYKRYIKSPEWQEKVKEFRKTECEICGCSGKLNLHHLSYKHLMFEENDDLATLCNDCHLACHIGLVSSKKLKNPSKAAIKIIRRIRDNKHQKQTPFCLFLRRNFIAKYGDICVPEFKFFRKFYSNNIRGKEYPWRYSIAKL